MAHAVNACANARPPRPPPSASREKFPGYLHTITMDASRGSSRLDSAQARERSIVDDRSASPSSLLCQQLDWRHGLNVVVSAWLVINSGAARSVRNTASRRGTPKLSPRFAALLPEDPKEKHLKVWAQTVSLPSLTRRLKAPWDEKPAPILARLVSVRGRCLLPCKNAIQLNAVVLVRNYALLGSGYKQPIHKYRLMYLPSSEHFDPSLGPWDWCSFRVCRVYPFQLAPTSKHPLFEEAARVSTNW